MPEGFLFPYPFYITFYFFLEACRIFPIPKGFESLQWCFFVCVYFHPLINIGPFNLAVYFLSPGRCSLVLFVLFFPLLLQFFLHFCCCCCPVLKWMVTLHFSSGSLIFFPCFLFLCVFVLLTISNFLENKFPQLSF